MTNAVANARGRDVALLVRIPFSDEKLHRAGMNVREWLEEKLLDILVMSHFKNNYDVPLEPWLSLCRDSGGLFYPSLEAAGPMDNAPAHNAKQHGGDTQ